MKGGTPIDRNCITTLSFLPHHLPLNPNCPQRRHKQCRCNSTSTRSIDTDRWDLLWYIQKSLETMHTMCCYSNCTHYRDVLHQDFY